MKINKQKRRNKMTSKRESRKVEDAKTLKLTSEEIDQERLEMNDVIRREKDTANRFNKFCNENGVLSPFVNPRNHVPVDSDYLRYALIDYSLQSESLREVQKSVIEPINEYYREVTGNKDHYFNIGEFIRECFVRGLEEFDNDEFALDEYAEETRNMIDRSSEYLQDTDLVVDTTLHLVN